MRKVAPISQIVESPHFLVGAALLLAAVTVLTLALLGWMLRGHVETAGRPRVSVTEGMTHKSGPGAHYVPFYNFPRSVPRQWV